MIASRQRSQIPGFSEPPTRGRAMARPSKLTPVLRERIELAVSSGCTYRAAAMSAGIAESTFHSWMARGRAEQGATKRAPGEQPYVLLVDAVEEAAARAEVRASVLIAKAAETDWRAAAWFLERRDPETFGPPRQRLEHATVTADELLAELLDQATDEELEILQGVAARARSTNP
jgi:transposase-like protein